MISNAHSLTTEDAISRLQVDPAIGLTSAEAEKRLLKYGKNRLERTRPKRIWMIFLEQFLDPVIYVLAGATLLAFLFNEILEGFAVLVVILITASIGFLMEWQAVRSVEALQKLVETFANVLRDGQEKHLNLQFLVPGDIILLNAGDVVPADARLLEEQSLAVKEAALTGESNQVDKNTGVLSEKTVLAERSNMLFKATIISRGSGRAIVTTTGDNTVIGEISRLTRESTKVRTPLERKLSRLSHKLIWLTIFLAIIITVTGYLQGESLLLMIKTGIALAVAAIPEGLPIVATIALARGMLKLSHRQVVIKKLEAVETLGATGIICTDKTGTLTENKMAVHRVVVMGSELGPEEWCDKITAENILQKKNFTELLRVAVLCNNSKKIDGKLTGDPIEVGLLNFSEEIGFDIENIKREFPRIKEIPFDADIKKMATVHANKDTCLLAVKGALEKIIESCEKILQEDGSTGKFTNKEEWLKKSNALAASGMRVLAFAFRRSKEPPLENAIFEDLVFIGITAFLDPPRNDIRQAINTYKNAGIKVVMVTGDHPETARKIGEEIGLINSEGGWQEVIHGGELPEPEKIPAGMEKKVLEATIFARMAPKQKLDLVTLYQRNNKVVGMLGDGVNDAPALKKADIGIAMGIRGTEAAKEVADVILMDDKFTSTELAIRQGRTIFENIRQFVVFLLSCNLAEIISVAAAAMVNLPMPLLPLQILFLNLITDVFPALALGMGRGDKKVMLQPPRDPKEPILTDKLWISTLVFGITITLAVIGITIYSWHFKEYSLRVVNNMAFYTLIFAQLLNVFNLPKRQRSFWINEVTKNPWIWGSLALSLLILVVVYHLPVVAEVLNLAPLNLEQVVTIGMFGLAGLLLTQILKRIGLTI